MIRKSVKKEMKSLYCLKNHQILDAIQLNKLIKTLINKGFFAGAKILNKK